MTDWRFIALRVLTGEILDFEVPFTVKSAPRRDLSGPGGMEGSIGVEYGRLIGSDGLPIIQEWSTALFAEADGLIRGGGIVVGCTFNGQSFDIEVAGYSSYPKGIPYLGAPIRAGLQAPDPEDDPNAPKDENNDGYVDGTTPPRSTKMPAKPAPVISPLIDAFDVVRALWTHVQAQPSGNIGMVVDQQKSGVLLGSADGKAPYELLKWEAPDCGQEIDSLARTTGFEYVEEHSWIDAGRGAIAHRLRLAYPKFGARREDLRFAQDENITEMVVPEGLGDAYANTVIGVGAKQGEARELIAVTRQDGRLRRCAVIDNATASTTRLTQLVNAELQRSTQGFYVPNITVCDHLNAPVGSWRPGDEILIVGDLPWLGPFAVWHRIVADQALADGTAKITLIRADSQ